MDERITIVHVCAFAYVFCVNYHVTVTCNMTTVVIICSFLLLNTTTSILMI
jgi:hypothetical protein